MSTDWKILLFVLWTLPAGALAQYSCETNNNTITITGYTGPGGKVTIPGTFNSLPVINIDKGAFYGYTGLTDVTIPDSVTNIGNVAFSGCTGLTSVVIGCNVVSIGNGAFYGCSRLIGVSIPGSVTEIGPWAFGGCSELLAVCFEGDIPVVALDAFTRSFAENVNVAVASAVNGPSAARSLPVPEFALSETPQGFAAMDKIEAK